MGKPWDKLPEETWKEYAKFQEYLQLGPERTLGLVGARKGAKRRGACGYIAELSMRFNWGDRAAAWDIYQFQILGCKGINRFATAISDFAGQTVAALRTKKPRTWKEITDAIHTLSMVIPPEVLAALLSGQDSSGPVPDGPAPFQPQPVGGHVPRSGGAC